MLRVSARPSTSATALVARARVSRRESVSHLALLARQTNLLGAGFTESARALIVLALGGQGRRLGLVILLVVKHSLHLGDQRPIAQTLADDLLGLRALLLLFEGGRSYAQTNCDHARPARILLRGSLLVAPQGFARSLAELVIAGGIRLRLLVSFSPFLRDGDFRVTLALPGIFHTLRARALRPSRALH